MTGTRRLAILICLWTVNNTVIAQIPNPVTGHTGPSNKDKPIRLIRTIKPKEQVVQCGAFSGDGRRFYIGTLSNNILVWDFKANKQIGKFHHPSEQKGIGHLAVSPDRSFIASQVPGTRNGGSVCMWNLRTKANVWRIDKLTSSSDMAFSPNGKLIAFVDFHDMWLCDAESGRILWKHRIDPGLISRLRFSPDGAKLIFSGHGYGFLRVFDVKRKMEIAKIDFDVPIATAAIEYSADGSKLFIGGADSPIWFYHLRNKKLTALHIKVDGWVRSLSLPSKSNLLIIANNQRQIHLYDIKQRKLINSLQTGSGGPLIFSTTDRSFATVEPTGELRFWEYSNLLQKE